MIICICNNISDKCVDINNINKNTIKKFSKEIKMNNCCGKCLQYLNQQSKLHKNK